MTGTIVALEGNTRTGTIQSRDGSRIAFSAAGVLGDFDSLAVGNQVSFGLDRAQPRDTAACVFSEPSGGHAVENKPGVSPDLRYTGFHHAHGVRSYFFDTAVHGYAAQHFIVRVEMALLLKHHIGVQEVPALCLHKLEGDLRDIPASARHELGDDDLLAYASSRAAADERRRVKRSVANRRISRSHGTSSPVLAS